MWTHLLIFLAVARLARLATVDRVTRPLRDWAAGVDRDELGNRVGPARRPMVDYFVDCPWCTSMYLAVPLVVAHLVWPTSDVVLGIALVLAASLVAGLVASVESIIDATVDALDALHDRAD